MGADHPVSWCKDYQGGRSFYTALGNTAAAYDAQLTTHLQGRDRLGRRPERPGLQRLRRDRAAQLPADEDLARRRTSTSRSASTSSRTAASSRPPARGTVRLHNPVDGHDAGHRRLRRPRALPLTQRIYTNSEDGLYGPAVDNDFATNKWVYLYYSPQTVTDVKLSDGSIVTQTTPNDGSPPPTRADPSRRGIRTSGYFQLSRFKFVEDAERRAPGPRFRAADPAGPGQPAGVLPRRGRHRLRQAQQPVAGHG